MNVTDSNIKIKVLIDDEETRNIDISRAELMRNIAMHTGELRFLLPAYRKSLMPDESEDSKLLCELLVNMIPMMYGIKTK